MSTLSSEIIASIFGQFEDFLRKVGNMDIFDTLVYNYRLKLSSSLNYEFIDLFSQLLDKLTDLRNNLIQWNSIQEFTFSIASPPCANESVINNVSTFATTSTIVDKSSPPASSPLTDDCFNEPGFDDVVSDLLTHGNSNFKVEDYTVNKLQIDNQQMTSQPTELLNNNNHNVEETTTNTDKVTSGGVVHKKLFLCHFCPKEYSTSQSLKAHLNTHLGVKFPCRFCSKTFTRRDKKIFHEAVHTGIKSFTCELCGRGFARKTKLDEHLRRHSGLKKYKCTFSTCNKCYASNRDLRNHIKSHESTDQKKIHNDNVQTTEQELQPIQQLMPEDDITSQVSEIFKLNWSELQFPGEEVTQQLETVDYNNIVKQPYF